MTDNASRDEVDIRAIARQLTDDFAAGWSRGRVDLMMAVFAEGAVLIETPFSTPLTGLEAIRSWASDIPYHQSEVVFTTGEIFVAGPWFSTEFKLVFRRRKSGAWVDARGAFFAETADGRITEMRMYWHRWNGGRETSLP
ncbi:MAG: nuclear transport factor 2 family protein [Gemmatimonadota bacterium]